MECGEVQALPTPFGPGAPQLPPRLEKDRGVPVEPPFSAEKTSSEQTLT